jgi:hypothetical protein
MEGSTMKQSKANRRRAESVEKLIHQMRRDAAQNSDCPLRCVPRKDTLIDLLANIRHYCDRRGYEFHALDRMAYRHYSEERGENV